MAGPSKSPNRTQLEEAQPPGSPPTRPMTPPPLLDPTGSNKGGVLLEVGLLGARALGPGTAWGTPGWVGSGLGGFGLGLSTVLAYRWRSIQNRAQTVKAKMHI